MNDPKHNDLTERDSNPDAITGAPGSHPVGTGVGAGAGGLAGAAAGTMVGGPIGGVVGAVIGAVAGGLGGKAAGEAIDPTVEDAYWRANHGNQPYATGSSYNEYESAYRTGYEGYSKQGAARKSFEDSESELRTAYQARNATVPWDKARSATRAAWDRVSSSGTVKH